MKLSVFGTGYVGLVTGACLANVGHDVVCMDIDVDKIARLNKGTVHIYEPGLQEIVERNLNMGTLAFTNEAERAVCHGEVLFITVGTPPNQTGAADLKYVLQVAENIARDMGERKVVVVKSTVPVGTSDKVHKAIGDILKARHSGFAYDVVSNPEFLKEGAAVADFLKPDRIIVGTASQYACDVMNELYEPFNRSHNRTIHMDVRSAELTKYAANAMLATKISFINEIANLAELLDADIEQVRRGIGSDPRIGYDFIYPGMGYGGSCFPKDVQALAHAASELGYDAPLIAAVETVNRSQKERLFEKISGHFGGRQRLAGRTFALWGLAFKPGTDDMREAPSRVLLQALWAAGARVQAFDPVAMPEAARIYGDRDDLVLCADKYAALNGADALILCTEWPQFRAPDFDEIADRLHAKVLFDGRNVFPPQRLADDGWSYFSVGRRALFAKPQVVGQAV